MKAWTKVQGDFGPDEAGHLVSHDMLQHCTTLLDHEVCEPAHVQLSQPLLLFWAEVLGDLLLGRACMASPPHLYQGR
jgi:hypothetical protein